MSAGESRKVLSLKHIVGGLLLIVVVCAVLFGRELVNLARLYQGFEDLDQERLSHQEGVYELVQACVSCHGFDGNSKSEVYPSLAGLPAAYLAEQLAAFSEGRRHSPMMTPLAMSLSQYEIEQLADYYANSIVTPANHCNYNEQRPQKPAALLVTCVACHGPELSGGAAGQPDTPRLAGQGEQYLVHQLQNFRSGQRRGENGIMEAITRDLSDQDVAQIASDISCMPSRNAEAE